MNKQTEEYISKYLSWLSKNAPKARKIYPVWLRRFARYTNKGISEIDDSDVANFIKDINVFKPPHLSEYSENSINNCKLALRAFFTYLERRGIPTPNIEMIRVKRRQASRPDLRYEDYQRILITLSAHNSVRALRDELVIRLLWETGARVLELCNLRIHDLDIRSNCAYIKNLNDARRRWLVWSNETGNLMKKYLVLTQTDDESSYLFSLYTTDGKQTKLYPRAVQRLVQECVAKSGLENVEKRIVPQSFRTRIARSMHNEGYDMSFVQIFLGYSRKSINITPSQYCIDDFLNAASNRFQRE